MKKKLWLLFLILLAVCAPLFAQSAGNVENASLIANVKVWVAPVSGGTRQEREYFDFNMREEVKGSGYLLADSLTDSDFYIFFTLEHDDVYGDEIITAELYLTETNELIITTGMGYQVVEEMNEWNLTMIYQLMANAPLNKYISTWVPPSKKKSILSFPEYWLYLGLRGGYSFRKYQLLDNQSLHIEKGGTGWGHSFEAGVQVSFQPFPFLAVQAELLFTNDTVSFQYLEGTTTGAIWPTDAYRSWLLTVPLTVKGTFQLYDRLALNPFAGLYFTVPLNELEGTRFENNELVSAKGGKYTVPVGLTAGLEIGAVLGKERNRGTVFLDLRYSGDLGQMVWSEDDSPVYQRTGMISITAGYRYGFIKRKKPAPKE
ncbi:hypothetical protein FACS1894110_04150 [Spirochaetia bacterium]|nr:hypothetical protein FACS1894110_04150 [Spirochaetia bacterium]